MTDREEEAFRNALQGWSATTRSTPWMTRRPSAVMPAVMVVAAMLVLVPVIVLPRRARRNGAAAQRGRARRRRRRPGAAGVGAGRVCSEGRAHRERSGSPGLADRVLPRHQLLRARRLGVRRTAAVRLVRRRPAGRAPAGPAPPVRLARHGHPGAVDRVPGAAAGQPAHRARRGGRARAGDRLRRGRVPAGGVVDRDPLRRQCGAGGDDPGPGAGRADPRLGRGGRTRSRTRVRRPARWPDRSAPDPRAAAPAR